MLWVLETGLTDFSYQWLMENLKNKNIEYKVVKPVPYQDILLSPDFDTFKSEPSKQDDINIDPNQSIFAFGSMSLVNIAEGRGWKPGSFNNENFTFEKWSKGFGLDNLLNGDSRIARFSDPINDDDNLFFVRPCNDDKAFAGMVVTSGQFIEWQKKIFRIDDPKAKLNKDTMITIASYKEILSEARMIVVKGQVITGSYYKIGPEVKYTQVEDGDPVIEYTQEIVGRYQPAEAFVVDVALTNQGYKVIEINNINSVGLYRADVDRFVDAMMENFG